MEESKEPISVEVCDLQHKNHFRSVAENVPSLHVFELDADPKCPDCMFIEDTSVVIGNSVVVTQPGDKSRRPEIPPVLSFWESQREDKNSFIQHVTEMSNYFQESDSSDSQIPLLDGGDVLFVPDRKFYDENTESTEWRGDLFVGISARTNERGAEVLRQVFKTQQNIDVHSVLVQAAEESNDKALHLKSLTTALAPSTLLISTDSISRNVRAQINSILDAKYKKSGVIQWIEVPDAPPVNVTVINGVVFFPSGFPDSQAIVEQVIAADLRFKQSKFVLVEASEAAKADGALTCSSVLFQ